MASIIDKLSELARQTRTGDSFYNKKLPWIFRLKVDGESFVGPTGANGEALFILPINPDRFDYDLPYAMELTPQQEGGVSSEEAGFVLGEINISGTTGFKLRRQQTLTFANDGGKFTGGLGVGGGAYDEVSGQMSFWILAQRCFEGYSELQKDPKLGPKTRMEFHVMKDHLHLQVKPRRFKILRTAAKERVSYRYEISLAVIGAAESISFESPDERSLFDKIGDTINEIRESIQSAAATIDDLTAAMGELSRYVKGIASLVDDMRSIVNAATNFVSGAKSFFDIPAKFMGQTLDLIESTQELFEEIDTIPSDVYHSLQSVHDEFCRMKVAARDHFYESWDEISNDYENQTESAYGTNVSDRVQNDIDEKASDGSSSQGLMTIDKAFGGAVKPGDQKRQSLATIQRRLSNKNYTGFTERVVGQGDTIQSLAAKHLGNARDWIDLVIANRLVAPYVTNGVKIPNTVTVGDKIIVPITQSSKPPNVFTTGDSEAGESQAESFLGTDYELTKDGDRWGWEIDVAHGSVDAKMVSGIDCLGQGLASRLRTTKNENILYPDVGIPRITGKTLVGDDTIETRFWVRNQLLSDPRIEKITNFSFEIINDALIMKVTVQPIGFNTARTISRVLT